MAVAYSTDLRERVVRAYQAGEGNQAQIAQRFQVSPSIFQRLLRRYRQSGQVTAKQRGGNHQPKIQGEHLDLVKRLVQSKPDAYLTELAEQFTQQTGILVSRVTMHRCIQRLRLSTKKNATRQRAGQ